MNQPQLKNEKSSRSRRNEFFATEIPPDFLRVTRSQTLAAQEEMRRQPPIEIKKEPVEPVILRTRYPIRRQPIPVEKTQTRQSASRKAKKQSAKHKESVPPVTPECSNVQQLNKPAPPVAHLKKHTRTRGVQTPKSFMTQTEQSLTESEMLLIKSLRARRLDVDKVRIVSSQGEHIITTEEEPEPEIEEINLTALNNNNMPTPSNQMPIRPGSGFLPQSISNGMFDHDPARPWDYDEIHELLCRSRFTYTAEFWQAAAEFITAPLRNNTYGKPSWYPPPRYYPNNDPWGP